MQFTRKVILSKVILITGYKDYHKYMYPMLFI